MCYCSLAEPPKSSCVPDLIPLIRGPQLLRTVKAFLSGKTRMLSTREEEISALQRELRDLHSRDARQTKVLESVLERATRAQIGELADANERPRSATGESCAWMPWSALSSHHRLPYLLPLGIWWHQGRSRRVGGCPRIAPLAVLDRRHRRHGPPRRPASRRRPSHRRDPPSLRRSDRAWCHPTSVFCHNSHRCLTPMVCRQLHFPR